MQLIIGNKNYSSWSFRPWLLLRHFDLPFEETRIPLFTAEFDTTLRKYSDAGKVPVLIDNGLTVWDSLAICEYISEQYLQGAAYPEAIVARAECRSACAEMHSGFMQIRQRMPMNCRSRPSITFTPELTAEINRIDRLWQQLRKKYHHLGDWLFGEFSIADCMYAPVASRFYSYQPDLSRTSLQYMDKIINHSAVKSWYQQANDEKEVLPQEEVGQ